jgi:putative hydrolase of the HAD superfamily
MFKTIVFDLFRTLVSPEAFNPDAYKRVDRMAERLNLDFEDFQEWWLSSRVERNCSRIPKMEQRIREYCDSIGKPRSNSLIEDALNYAQQFHDQALLHPQSDVPATMTDLHNKGIKLGLLSNADEREILYWNQSPLVKMLDSIAFSVDIGAMKPDPRSYKVVLEKLGDEPALTIYVGDGEGNELVGAREAGFGKVIFMRGNVLGNGFTTPEKIAEYEKQADNVVDLISDVPSVL